MSSSNRIGGIPARAGLLHIQPTTQTSDTAPLSEGGLQALAPAKAAKAKPVNLFDANTFQKTVRVDDGAGTAFALPALSDDELAQAKTLFAKVPDEHKAALNAASEQLGQALFAQLSQLPPAKLTDDGSDAGTASLAVAPLQTSRLAVGLQGKASVATTNPNLAATRPSPAVVSATQNAATSYVSATNLTAPGSDAVMATAYMGVASLQGQLGDFAQNMQDTINAKKGFDADASELQDAITNWPDGVTTQVLPKVVTNQDGTVTVTQEALTKDQAKDSMQAAKDASQNYGGDQQIQMIQMQQIQSNYANAINMISNIMKTGYDTTKNTIGNIHA